MMPWVPVVDGDEVPYHPLTALTTNRFNKVPILFGTVANESVEFIWDIVDTPLSSLETYVLAAAVFGEDRIDRIMEVYGPPPSEGDCHHYLEVIATDYIFYCPNRFVGTQLTQTTPTYMHLFDELASFSAWVYNASMPYCVTAVCHADDIPFYFNPFNAPLPPNSRTPPTPTAAEEELIAFMQKSLANFATGGNPNPLPNVVFPRFNGSINAVMNYSTPSSVLTGYRNSYCDFWDTIGYDRY